MRLLIRSFGPYAGEEIVDFEALAPLGLYVVAGPTGSGKTTIFDALVFALYGQVPGSRVPAELHTHHASPAGPPLVELVFEAHGDVYRVTRTPGYTRPKRRGDGETRVPSEVVLARRQGDAWEPVVAGPYDTDPVITEIVGLSVVQFQRVVLLPQGEFEQFLTCRSEERRTVLRRLFGSEVFERAVTELKRIAQESERRAADAAVRVDERRRMADELIAELSALVGVPWSDAPAAGLAELGEAVERVAAEHAALEARATEAHQAAVAAHELRRRCIAREERRRRLAELRADPGRVDALADSIARASAAVPVLAASAAADDARGATASVADRVAQGEADVEVALARLPGRAAWAAAGSGGTDASRCREALAAARVTWSAAARLASQHVPLVAREHELRERCAAVVDAIEAAATDIATADGRIASAEAGMEVCRALASGVHEIEAAVATAERRARLVEAADTARQEIDRAAADADDARTEHDELTRSYLGAAAPRLAAALADGEPCLVCGSREHPAPARPATGARVVTIEEVERAGERAVAALGRRDAALGRLDALVAELTPLGEPDELDPGRAGEELAGLRRALESARAAQTEVASLGAAVVTATRRRADAVEAQHRLEVELSALVTAIEEVSARATSLQGELRELIGRVMETDGTDHRVAGADVATVAGRAARAVESIDAALRRMDELDRCRAEHIAASERAGTMVELAAGALDASPFSSLDDATAAALDANELIRRRELVDRWRTEVADAEAGERADAHLPEAAPDVAAFDAAATETRADVAVTAARLATGRALWDRLTRSAANLDADVDAAAAVLKDAELARTVHDRCAGHLAPKIALESWVLGQELDRVAHAANVHLDGMTSGRYRLRRAEAPLDGRGQAGLDLEVLDQHTGRSRRTTSLSGGERFQASLALALGLADALTTGTGAAACSIDALFVDEGFGSLDPEALDHAIDVLDRLRHHGRQIGVITHVEAMKTALAVGLDVVPLADGRGSTIRQRCA